MSPLPKYILMQVPGALFLGVILLMLRAEGWVETGTALIIMGLWVLKDALLYPFSRPALEDAGPEGVEPLVGERGTCLTAINGLGLIQVRGEHWQARSATDIAIAPGNAVRVVGFEGRVLIVAPEPEEAT
ncbi:MAG: NfeD family protein [Oleiphilaceae bacterium]|nr:NfeD family protein [Oleiphilaceae bacterium]